MRSTVGDHSRGSSLSKSGRGGRRAAPGGVHNGDSVNLGHPTNVAYRP
jgi:hypothetical protein